MTDFVFVNVNPMEFESYSKLYRQLLQLLKKLPTHYVRRVYSANETTGGSFGSEVDSVLHALKFIVQAGGGVLPKALEMP